jgi:hypothetical protein
MQALSIRAVLDRHGNDTIDHRKEPTMQYCLLMHCEEAADAGGTRKRWRADGRPSKRSGLIGLALRDG